MSKNHHGGVLHKIKAKWELKRPAIKRSSSEYRRLIMRRIAQREIIKSLDLPSEKRVKVLKATNHSLRLDDAFGNSTRHTNLPLEKANRLLKDARDELVEMLRVYHHVLDQTSVEFELAKLRNDIGIKLDQLLASKDKNFYLLPSFIKRL